MRPTPRGRCRLPFRRELKKRGFTRDGGMRDPLIYKKTVGDRKLDLQLWKDGHHRVSHWLGRRQSTNPTVFKTVLEMEEAIAIELARTDHPPKATYPHGIFS